MPRRDEPTRRALGWCLLVGGALALFGALAGTITAWVLVGDAQRSSGRALVAAEESLDSVNDSLNLAGGVVTTVRQGIDTVAAALHAAGGAIDTADATLAQLQQVAAALPTALRGTTDAIHSLTTVADGVDRTLSVLSQAPFVPDYRSSLGDLVRRLDQSLTPLVAGTEDLSSRLQSALANGQDVGAQVNDLADDVGMVQQSLASASQQLDNFRAATSDAQAAARTARRDLDRDLTLLRFVALPLGLGLALAQLLPIWFGAGLLWPERVPVSPAAGRSTTTVAL